MKRKSKADDSDRDDDEDYKVHVGSMMYLHHKILVLKYTSEASHAGQCCTALITGSAQE